MALVTELFCESLLVWVFRWSLNCGDHLELLVLTLTSVVLAQEMSCRESRAEIRGGRLTTLEALSNKSSSEPHDSKDLQESIERRDSEEDVGWGGAGLECKDRRASRAACNGEAENRDATRDAAFWHGKEDRIGGTGCPNRLA